MMSDFSERHQIFDKFLMEVQSQIRFNTELELIDLRYVLMLFVLKTIYNYSDNSMNEEDFQALYTFLQTR